MKKKKLQPPHDVVKSYLKVAQDRLKEVFFTRPEWRKPKSAKQLELFFSRIDEIYYPFSSKDKHMVAVWRQVLKEKREEMLDELKAALSIPVEKANNTEDRRRGTESASSVCPLPLGEWPKARITDLKKKVKAKRCGSKIAREIGIKPCTLHGIISGAAGYNEAKRGEWLNKIEAALLRLDPLEFAKRFKLLQADIDEIEFSVRPEHKTLDAEGLALPPITRDMTLRTCPATFPQIAKTLVSNMSVDIVGDKMHVLVTVDIAEAVRLAKLAQDEVKVTIS